MTDNYNYKIIENYTELYFVNEKQENFISYVDTEDLEKLFAFPYTFFPRPNHAGYYLHATEYLGIDEKPVNRMIRYHRWILGIDKYDKTRRVDHENHNTLDNRKSNLRVTTTQKNLQHRKTRNKNNQSGYRNVCLISGWYRIQLQVNGANHLFPEKFRNAEEAGVFADAMRLKYYGEYSGNN